MPFFDKLGGRSQRNGLGGSAAESSLLSVGAGAFFQIWKRCSNAAKEISISSSTSSAEKAPTVTMSRSRMAFQEKVRPT